MRWLRRLTQPPVARPFSRPSLLEPLEQRALLSGSLLITEFMADNKSTLADENGDFSDWIELQNTSAVPIDLAGWKLRDSGATWTFPSKTLTPGQVIVVFASDKNRTNPALPLHTNFKLGATDDSLSLIRPDGTIERAFDPYPEQFEDVSYGLSQLSQTLLAEGAPLGYKVPTAGDAGLGTTWTMPAFNDAAFATTTSRQVSRVLITEAATGTEFIEVQNVSPVAVNTQGWFIAASNSNTDINAVNAVLKPLPATMTANQVTYFIDNTADPEANRWGGSGITWSTTGSGWVMVVDNAGNVADFVSWGFSASTIASFNVTINGNNITAADLGWSGAGVSSSGATTSNSMKRTGTSDGNTAANFAFSSGQTKGTANSGLTTPFAPSTVTATTGIGYSVNGAGAGFDVTVYKANIGVETLAAAESVVSTPALQSSVSAGRFDVVNFLGTGAVGNYANDAVYPGSTAGQDVDDYVSVSTTRVFIPRPGKWTFGVSSDDGFRLEVAGHSVGLSIEFDGLRGATNTLGVLDAPVAGIYDVRLLQFDHLGGSSVEFFAAEGEHAAINAGFDLVGDVESGGLAAAGFTADIATPVQPQMRNVNSSIYTRIDFDVASPAAFDALTLNMKYDAGFIAYLNGEEVARRSAPAAAQWDSAATAERAAGDAAFYEAIDITPFLISLVPGVNVLAIHGLNSSAGNDDFILLPQITAGSTGEAVGYFTGPTPGATNAAGVTAFIEDITFSVDHGFYAAAFQLTLATNTAGATIRYTTNGSTPSTTNGTVYSGPITVSKTTVLRAIAFKTGFTSTPVETKSYFFVSDVVTQSSATATALGFPASNVNGQVIDYGMDPDIVNSATWGPQLAAALTDIPSMSIVTDIGNLFSASTGIYVNAGQDGALWERPVSLELIDPSGAEEGFQIDAGLRIRGGFSRSNDNPKHSFRLFFRSEYGEGKLEYPLFGDEGLDEYDKIDLRTSQNYSWAFGGDARNIMNRDVFFRDLQRDMEEGYARSRYYHLYLNGQYWGLYQTQERTEAAFAADYLGGEPEDYDVVKVEAGPYTINATDGNLDAWNALWTLAGQGFETDAKYYAVQGKNPDGTRNPALPVYIDQDNLIKYMINILYGGNLDAPISNFLGNNSPNNWYGVYNRTTKDQGFQFFAHDNEHTLLTSNLSTNRNGPFPAGDTFDKSNPQWIHQKLMAHPEYRLRFADLVQQAFFNDGPLTVQNNIERFMARAAEIEKAIIAESARWGDAKVSAPFTKDHWQAEINAIVNTYFPQRGSIVLAQLRNTTLTGGAAAPLFPSIDAPTFNVHGGAVGDDFGLLMTSFGGLVYYTFDGTDPRLPGGAISPSALVYDPATTVTTLLPAGATWKYLDNGTNQGTAWRAPGFNDAAWASGAAQLGYGDGDEATTVSFGGNAAAKHITTYFRKTFTVADLSQITSLTLRLLRDDGAAVYINGQEVTAARTNLPANPAFNTIATATVGGADETTFFNIPISAAFLVEGVNTIAVEIHQAAADSTDLSFDLELLGNKSNAQPVALPASGPVVARARSASNEWSAATEATFLLNAPPTAQNLVVTELNYHPQGPTAAELLINAAFTEDSFEFVELMNNGAETIDLPGVRFAAGIAFDFSNSSITTLAPGQRVLVVSDLAGFQARYGTGLPVAGVYTGQLTNSGEQVLLVDGNGAALADITFSDIGDWPSRPDGGGSSLEAVSNTGDYNDPARWRSSSEVGGSPGIAGLGPDNRIVVNEVLSHTDPPLKDTIELLNRTGASINISGWYLTDDTDNLTKYRIPNGTSIAAGGYRVYNEDQFNPGLGTLPNDFSLNAAHGDSVYLVQADANGKPIRFVDAVSFGAQANAESWGRFPNGTGELTPMLTRSLGSANGNPRVGPIVISEIMYNAPVPAGGLPVGVTVDDLEFIEIFNPTAGAVDLVEWRIRGGIDFDFATIAATQVLAPGAAMLIVSFDPLNPLNATRLATFRSVYGLDASVPILGGYGGQLADGGETIRLERPDEPPIDEPLFFPRLLEDRVVYDDDGGWPVTPDGGGQALRRSDSGLASYGGLPTTWTAAAPTPGTHVIAIPNDPPVANNNSYNATEDVPLVIAAGQGVLANDSDPDGDPLTASVLTSPAHGSLTLSANGSFTYTPNANYNGPDSFTYNAADGKGGFDDATVNLTIAAANDAPIANADSYATNEDTPLVVAAAQGVLANDSEVDGDTMAVQAVVTQPLHGSLTLNANGSFTYTPAANYSGPDSFVYRVTDGKNPAGLATATVSLTVNAVNDAPVAGGNSYNGAEDTPLVVPAAQGVLANDSDPEGAALVASIVAQPLHGSVALNGDGSFTYTPHANYAGADSFTYRATDAQGGFADAVVTITLAASQDPPVALNDLYDFSGPQVNVSAALGVLANDVDPDGDALTVTLIQPPALGALTLNPDGSFTYTPGPLFVASDSFLYQVSDGKGNTATAGATLGGFSGNAPVLVAVGNGAIIATGDTTPAAADHTAFGAMPVSNTFGGVVTRAFTLRNDGNAALRFTGASPVTLTGAHAGDFAIITQPAVELLLPGEFTTIEVQFDPSAAGTRSAVVHIASDDPGDEDYTFAVEGSGVAASGPSVISIVALDASAAETSAGQPANTATFRILRAGATTGSLVVKLSRKGTAKFGAAGDYTLSVGGTPLTSTSVLIPAGQDHVDITVNVVDNALTEPSETVILGVAAGKGYSLTTNTAQRTATATIADNEPLVTVAAIDAAAAETGSDEPANTALFRISRGSTAGLAAPLTVKFTIKGAAGFGATKDYTISVNGVNLASTSAGVVIPAGEDHVDLLITPVDNALVEPAESLSLSLTKNTAYTLDPVAANNTATVTIADNEPVVTITAADASASEPGAGENHGRFVITRTGSTALPLSVKLTKSGSTAASDFIALPTTIVIPAGESSVALDVVALADTLTEANETVTLALAASTAYSLPALAVDKSATVTITNSPVSVAGIDLALLAATYPAMTISLGNLAGGASKTVTASVRNQGGASSGAFTLEYFLSADRVLDDAEDYPLFSAANQLAVAAGATQLRAVKLTSLFVDAGELPAPGGYFLIVRIVPASPDAIAGNDVFVSALNNVTITA